MDVPTVCECGNPIVQPKRGRHRTKCTDCSPARPGVKNPKVIKIPETIKVPVLLTVVRETLRAAGREDTPDGATALYLAAQLDQGGHTGPTIATLAREMRAACNAAIADAPEAGDVLDELRARRGG